MSTARSKLRERIEAAAARPTEDLGEDAEEAWRELCAAMRSGHVRPAEPTGGGWKVNSWVKKGILLGFRLGQVEEFPASPGLSGFFDKHTLLVRKITLEDDVRVVAGGSSIRDGALTVPPGAVIASGSRPAKGRLAEKAGVHVYTPVILKYRDPGTDAAVALEDALR